MKRQTIGIHGFTLTELAIVLGVMGIITGAIWVAASNTSESRKDNDAVLELQTVAQNMNNVFQGRTLANCAGTINLTSCMIAAQIISSTYVDAAVPTTADNPWSTGNFMVYQIGTKTFRLSFYNASYKGCMDLLLQATNCTAGQIGCPIQALTTALVTPGDICVPNQKNCPSAAPTYTAGLGWGAMTPTIASAMCGDNTPVKNSVEFDYSL